MTIAAGAIKDPSLAWVSGGMPLKGFPLGGHLHFSRVRLSSALLRALDNYLALPLMLIEDAATSRRRPRYGTLGDARHQPHGGFEYRTLPSWLMDPLLTGGVFALAALIAGEYQHLQKQPLLEPTVTAAYYNGDKDKVLGIVRLLWHELEQLPSYSKYEPELNALKTRILKMEPWDSLTDFRHAWGLIPVPVPVFTN
jgi:hypothetical protein